MVHTGILGTILMLIDNKHLFLSQQAHVRDRGQAIRKQEGTRLEKWRESSAAITGGIEGGLHFRCRSPLLQTILAPLLNSVQTKGTIYSLPQTEALGAGKLKASKALQLSQLPHLVQLISCKPLKCLDWTDRFASFLFSPYYTKILGCSKA